MSHTKKAFVSYLFIISVSFVILVTWMMVNSGLEILCVYFGLVEINRFTNRLRTPFCYFEILIRSHLYLLPQVSFLYHHLHCTNPTYLRWYIFPFRLSSRPVFTSSSILCGLSSRPMFTSSSILYLSTHFPVQWKEHRRNKTTWVFYQDFIEVGDRSAHFVDHIPFNNYLRIERQAVVLHMRLIKMLHLCGIVGRSRRRWCKMILSVLMWG